MRANLVREAIHVMVHDVVRGKSWMGSCGAHRIKPPVIFCHEWHDTP